MSWFVLAQSNSPSYSFALTVIAVLIMGSLSGFVLGVWYGSNRDRWKVEKYAKEATRLLPLVLKIVNQAEHACRKLEAIPKLKLSSKETKQLQSRQTALQGVFTKLIDTLESQTQIQKEKKLKTPKPTPPPEWKTEPVDEPSGLPDQPVLEENLERLVSHCQESRGEGGILLIKLNNYESFKERYGMFNTEDLFKQCVALVLPQILEGHLLCRASNDTICLLLPGTDAKSGQQTAQEIRNKIRHGSFRLRSTKSEVLLSTSMGYSVCRSSEDAIQLLHRAQNAVERSAGKGRHQLFLNDGVEKPRCISVSE